MCSAINKRSVLVALMTLTLAGVYLLYDVNHPMQFLSFITSNTSIWATSLQQAKYRHDIPLPVSLETDPAYSLVVDENNIPPNFHKPAVTTTENDYYHTPVATTWDGTSRPQLTYNVTSAVGKTKVILFYNHPFWWGRSLCKPGIEQCPIRTCICSYSQGDLTKADAVIFDMVGLTYPQPPRRYPNQVWIAFGLESPAFYETSNHASMQWRLDVFNWTMTYRLDSDIVVPYNILIRLAEVPKRNFTAIALGKSKTAAWMVSKCAAPSMRDMYVKKLQTFYPVDVYGGCGQLKIPRNEDSKFMTLLNTTYRFYLAFENSLCKDYVTEKLFKTFDVDVVAIVRGGADYTSLIPAGTYINTADFSSARKLADYLQYLERNVTAYSEILRRKSQYTISKQPGSPPSFQKSYCDICMKLHNIDKYRHVYHDSLNWLRDGICHAPNDLS